MWEEAAALDAAGDWALLSFPADEGVRVLPTFDRSRHGASAPPPRRARPVPGSGDGGGEVDCLRERGELSSRYGLTIGALCRREGRQAYGVPTPAKTASSGHGRAHPGSVIPTELEPVTTTWAIAAAVMATSSAAGPGPAFNQVRLAQGTLSGCRSRCSKASPGAACGQASACSRSCRSASSAPPSSGDRPATNESASVGPTTRSITMSGPAESWTIGTGWPRSAKT